MKSERERGDAPEGEELEFDGEGDAGPGGVHLLLHHLSRNGPVRPPRPLHDARRTRRTTVELAHALRTGRLQRVYQVGDDVGEEGPHGKDEGDKVEHEHDRMKYGE